MSDNKKILKYAVAVIVAALLAGLAAWYFFLEKQAGGITTGDSARGLGTSAPSFGNTIGSTYGNIVAGISSLIGGTSGESAGNVPPRLWQVTKTPVAGMGFVGNATSSKLYFAESSTGNIISADPKTGALARLSNKLVPRIYEAIFGRDGSFVLRSVNDEENVESFAGSALSTTSAQKYLPRNIQNVVPNPKTNGILFLLKNTDGEGIAVSSSWDGANPKIVFSSPLSNWKLLALRDGKIFFVIRPADGVPGFAYELKKDGALSPQVRDVPGLTFLPRAESPAVLFGESGDGALTLFSRVRDDAAVFPLPIRTIADKCLWDTANEQLVAYCAVPQYVVSKNFLNDWHRGAVHTNDTWWKVDASSGNAELFYSPSTSGPIDVENPVMDESGENIAFINARDKTLWVLRVKQNDEKNSPAP